MGTHPGLFTVVGLATVAMGCGSHGIIRTPDAGQDANADALPDALMAPDALISPDALTAPDAVTAPDALGLDTQTPLDSDADGTEYCGAVLAKLAQVESGNTYSVYTDFTAEQRLRPTICANLSPTPDICRCVRGHALPYPDQPPDAAQVTLRSPTGAITLATLTPTLPTIDASGVSSSFYGTLDLGMAWYTRPGDYARVDSQPWNPGDALLVAATGSQVPAFSGTLQTGLLLTGVTPSFGPEPLVIDRSQDFQVAWTAEGESNATVLLTLRQVSPNSLVTCTCIQPDSARSIVMNPSLLGMFNTEPLTTTIQLERMIISTISSHNATIDLVGAVAVVGHVTFQ
jgi:hypothetical protein